MPSAVPPPQDFEEASEAYNERLLNTANFYTGLGRQVVPLTPGKKSPAGGEGWNVPGNPLIATDWPSVYAIWAQKYRGCGIGMFCSYESRTVILDIDVKNGAQGPKSLMEHQNRFGILPPTMQNNSPSGGYHLIFEVPEEWQPVTNRGARFSVNGMEILFNRRQAVMAPTRTVVEHGGEYTPHLIGREPMRIATLTPEQMDAMLYGRVLEDDAPRTAVWADAHMGTLDIATDKRNELAEKVIDALSQYPSDSFGKAIVEMDVKRMLEARQGTRYPLLKQLGMHIVLAIINDGAVIKLDDALNDLMGAYMQNQRATNEDSPLEASNALDTMHWAVTRPSVLEGITSLEKMRMWMGAAHTMPVDAMADAEAAVKASKASYRASRQR